MDTKPNRQLLKNLLYVELHAIVGIFRKKENTVTILCYLRKAFDTVLQIVLFFVEKKLYTNGIFVIELGWFKNFFLYTYRIGIALKIIR